MLTQVFRGIRIFKTLGQLCLASCLVATAPAAWADYPDKPIRIVLGFAAGGGSDILLRSFTPALADRLGQPIVVDYKPGAGSNLAMDYVARAPADGYTLLMGSPGLATNTSLYSNLSFDPLKDFAPIGLVGSVQNVLLVRSDLPVSSVQELIAYAKQHPGKLNYASSGAGTSLHLAGELFKAKTKTDVVHVPYRGGSQAMNDLLGGQVDMMFNVLPSALAHIQAGKVKALAVTGAQRSSSLPDVPTMIEAGVPDYTAVTWNGLVAPAGTPPEIIKKINAMLNEVLATPEIQRTFAGIGQDPMTGTPEDFGKFLRDETEKWRAVIQQAGITAL